MEKRFPRRIDALDQIFAYVTEFIEANALDRSEAFPIDLVVEEIFTNFVRHNTDGSHPIGIRMAYVGGQIEIAITDRGVREFDLTKAPPVDTNAPIEERRPGGLGIHFVREIADSLTYEYADGNSTVIVTKRLET